MHAARAFGRHIADRRLGRIRVTLTGHCAHARTPRHDHPFPCLHWIIEGVYIEQDPSTVVVAGQGAILLKPSGLAHWNTLGGTQAVSLRVEHPALESVFEERTCGLLSDPTPGCRLTAALTTLARDLQQEAAERLEEDVDMVIRLFTTDAGRPERIAPPELRAARLLASNSSRSISIASLAEAVGIHRAHLARRFQSRFGCSPKQFHMRARVAAFARDLARGAESKTAIALRAGFFDQSHCTRQFARVFGSPPGVWLARQPT